MATEKQIEILTKLKEVLSYRLNNVSSKEVNPKNGYIWVGGQNGLIGNITCHYEFIFYNKEEDPEKDKNTLKCILNMRIVPNFKMCYLKMIKIH